MANPEADPKSLSVMNQTREQSGKSRPLHPHLLQVYRSAYFVVFLKASVTDSERLHFEVPPDDIENTLSSLILTDSRGTTPSVFVHSPIEVNVAPKGSEKAWIEVLNRYQGAKVGIETAHDKAEGTLVGFRHEHYNPSEDPGTKGTADHARYFIITRSGSKVSLHPTDSVTSLNFQDQAICDALSQDSFMKQYVVQRRNRYTIELLAHGRGRGEVEVRYSNWSRFSPGYEVNYVLGVDEDEDIYACGVRPDRNLKCYFTLHNPLPSHLSDVQIEFYSGLKQYDQYHWPYSSLEAKSEQNDDAKSSSNGTAGPKESYTGSSEGEEEEDFVDEFSDVSTATTMGENYAHQGNVVHSFPEKVSLNMNESIRILMFEKPCTGGIIRTMEAQQDNPYADVCVLLHNTTNANLEGGHLHVKSSCTGVSKTFHIFPLAIGEYVLRQLSSYSEIEWNTFKQVDVGDVHSYHVSEKQLVVLSEKTKTMIGRIQNKSDKEVELFVMHYLRSAGSGKGAVEGVLTKGSWLRGGEERTMEPYAHSVDYRSTTYKFKLGGHETCWVTIRERLKFEQKHMILEELKSATICELAVQQVLPPTALQSLRQLLSLGRESERLKLEQSLHRSKLKKLEAYRTGSRKNSENGKGAMDGQGRKSAEEELQEYHARTMKAQEARVVLEGLVDDNERRLFELHRETTAIKRQLAFLTS